jgi:sn-glycerol 3-phosphate transport system ATP-binding protein
MNLLDAHAEGGRVVIGDQSVSLNGHAVPDGPVTLGLRAEDMRLASGNGDTDIELAIDYVEELGAGRLVHGHVADRKLALSLPSGEPLADRLPVAIDKTRMHLFHARDGHRL